jgi:uncharacterized NAD(P)/FAD-binding protein YdhS
MDHDRSCDVVLIGSGLGACAALTRLARSAEPLRVVLLAGATGPGRGLAYDTDAPDHLLNVRAGRMGLDPADPGGFARWAAGKGWTAPDERFLPRAV